MEFNGCFREGVRWRLDAVRKLCAEFEGVEPVQMTWQMRRYVAEKLRLLPKLLERANRDGLPASRPDVGTS